MWAADVSPARRAWAIQRGVDARRAVADYREALPHVEAVDIVTPADTHLAIAERCFQVAKHCFVEKPLTMTADEGRRLETAADRAGRILQVGHIFRFHPVTATLREALDGRRIGQIRFATARFAGFKRPRTDVGVTHTDAIHYFDLFAFLFGRPARTVAAVQRDYLGRGLDDLSITVVTYGDIPALVEADYFVPGTHRECVIVGERGSLVADYGASTVSVHAGEHRRSGARWEAVDAGKEELATGRDEPLRLELTAFVEACAGRASVAVPARAGVQALEIVEAAARSARSGQTIVIGR